jgi:hypothetical protein
MGTLEKECYRGIVREHSQIWQAFGVWKFQRRYRKLMLGLYMQHLSTRHQHLKTRAGSQQVYYLYASGHNLLKVVQQK